jgi:hypothetical protein
LLNQNLSVHGLPPVGLLDGDNYASNSDAIGSEAEAEAEAEAAEAIKMADDEVMVAAAGDHSPTPISACSLFAFLGRRGRIQQQKATPTWARIPTRSPVCRTLPRFRCWTFR